MQIRWRGLELPSRVVRDEENSTSSYGRFIIEPFEQGFGTTIGNALRRILLSSLEGAAVSTVKIAGVAHEFSSIDGVLEDVTDIILNVKGIVLSLEGDEPKTMSVQRDSAGPVKVSDIVADPAITLANGEHALATLTADVPFQMAMAVRPGRGYVMAPDNRAPDQELGMIPVDSIFSPVVRVRYKTEDMRVGQRTNYDRLILEIWTKGTVVPEDALIEAATILRKHLNPIITYDELGVDTATPTRPRSMLSPERDAATEELLNKPVSVLGLSVRASNCLEAASIKTVRELVEKDEASLLRLRSFGKTSLHEVQRKLAEVGLELGCLPGAAAPESAATLGAPDKQMPSDFGAEPPPATPDAPDEGEGAPNHMEAWISPE